MRKKDGRPARVRLQDGPDFIRDLWPESTEIQRQEVLIQVLYSTKVPIRAKMAAKPRHAGGEPMLPRLESKGWIGTTVYMPNVEWVIHAADSQRLTFDIGSGRIAFTVPDDRRFWGHRNWEPFFPGGARLPTGRYLFVELSDVEFDAAAARTYIVENLLPANAVRTNQKPRQRGRKPGSKGSIAAALAWQIASKVLDDDKQRPPLGYGRVIGLARLVNAKLTLQGHQHQVDSICKMIRPSLREWERQHPGR